MKKILVTFLLLISIGSVMAGSFIDARREAVGKLFEKYPCHKFDTEADRTGCEMDKLVMLLDESLSSPDIKWKKLFNEQKAKLIEWQTEDARIRNRLKPKLGMSKSYIYKQVLGAPDAINDALDSGGMTSLWIYKEESDTLYLYFNSKGVLTSMQRSR